MGPSIGPGVHWCVGMSVGESVGKSNSPAELLAALSEALDADSIVPWAEIDTDKQQKIVAAIAPNQPPAGIALPTTEALGQVMALANKNGWRVLPMGQGSKLSWGGLATEGIDLVVSTERLNQVIEHAVGDFTVTVQPGMKVAELKQLLAEQGQFLAVDPAFEEQASLGGLVSTADTGSLRQRYGGLRDMLIGVQFVRYDGEVARAGGRVVKNVAGYDLMKLLTGAYGSLGIVSELTFRLYPVQPVSRTLVLSGGSSEVEAAISEVRMSGLTPVALDVLSVQLMASLGQTERLGLVARFQGIEDAVEEQTERIQKIATTHSMDCVQLDGTADSDFWQRSAEVIRPDTVLCKVGLRPTGIPWLIELADEIAPSSQLRLYGSSGLGWVQLELTDGTGDKPVDETGDEWVSVLEQLRSHCQKNAGFLTILQAPKPLKGKMEVWGYSGNALGVMKDIKEKFDPNKLLSPGRFVGGL
ncbi:MAG: FAD-binding oxidoreductase [Cyanobacteria bacterium P01_F01_bin.53]